MTHNIKKSALLAGFGAVASLLTVPAAAQVNGIATASPEAVIVQSKARIAAYQAIDAAYATQIQTAKSLSNEINTLNASMDTNGDRNVDQKEYDANPKVVEKVDAKQREIDVALQPIRLAQAYVIDQLTQKYEAARNQVLTKKKISLMLIPDAFQYAPEGIDVTKDILEAFNTLVPTVPSTPPAGYNPTADVVGNYQQIQQLLGAIMQRQAMAAAQQQQQGAQTPKTQPKAPSGR